jgi:hypothetical protein
MKKLLFVAGVAALCSGCVASNLTEMVKALGNDPATVHIKLMTPYGSLEVDRSNPGTNSNPLATIPLTGTVTPK